MIVTPWTCTVALWDFSNQAHMPSLTLKSLCVIEADGGSDGACSNGIQWLW